MTKPPVDVSELNDLDDAGYPIRKAADDESSFSPEIIAAIKNLLQQLSRDYRLYRERWPYWTCHPEIWEYREEQPLAMTPWTTKHLLRQAEESGPRDSNLLAETHFAAIAFATHPDILSDSIQLPRLPVRDSGTWISRDIGVEMARRFLHAAAELGEDFVNLYETKQGDASTLSMELCTKIGLLLPDRRAKLIQRPKTLLELEREAKDIVGVVLSWKPDSALVERTFDVLDLDEDWSLPRDLFTKGRNAKRLLELLRPIAFPFLTNVEIEAVTEGRASGAPKWDVLLAKRITGQPNPRWVRDELRKFRTGM